MYTQLKYLASVKLFDKAIGIYKVVSKNCKGYSSYYFCLRVTLETEPILQLMRHTAHA